MKQGFYEEDNGSIWYMFGKHPTKKDRYAIAYYFEGGFRNASFCFCDKNNLRDDRYLGAELPNHTIKVKNKKGKWIELEISRESFESITSEV